MSSSSDESSDERSDDSDEGEEVENETESLLNLFKLAKMWMPYVAVSCGAKFGELLGGHEADSTCIHIRCRCNACRENVMIYCLDEFYEHEHGERSLPEDDEEECNRITKESIYVQTMDMAIRGEKENLISYLRRRSKEYGGSRLIGRVCYVGWYGIKNKGTDSAPWWFRARITGFDPDSAIFELKYEDKADEEIHLPIALVHFGDTRPRGAQRVPQIMPLALLEEEQRSLRHALPPIRRARAVADRPLSRARNRISARGGPASASGRSRTGATTRPRTQPGPSRGLAGTRRARSPTPASARGGTTGEPPRTRPRLGPSTSPGPGRRDTVAARAARTLPAPRAGAGAATRGRSLLRPVGRGAARAPTARGQAAPSPAPARAPAPAQPAIRLHPVAIRMAAELAAAAAAAGPGTGAGPSTSASTCAPLQQPVRAMTQSAAPAIRLHPAALLAAATARQAGAGTGPAVRAATAGRGRLGADTASISTSTSTDASTSSSSSSEARVGIRRGRGVRATGRGARAARAVAPPAPQRTTQLVLARRATATTSPRRAAAATSPRRATATTTARRVTATTTARRTAATARAGRAMATSRARGTTATTSARTTAQRGSSGAAAQAQPRTGAASQTSGPRARGPLPPSAIPRAGRIEADTAPPPRLVSRLPRVVHTGPIRRIVRGGQVLFQRVPRQTRAGEETCSEDFTYTPDEEWMCRRLLPPLPPVPEEWPIGAMVDWTTAARILAGWRVEDLELTAVICESSVFRGEFLPQLLGGPRSTLKAMEAASGARYYTCKVRDIPIPNGAFVRQTERRERVKSVWHEQSVVARMPLIKLGRHEMWLQMRAGVQSWLSQDWDPGRRLTLPAWNTLTVYCHSLWNVAFAEAGQGANEGVFHPVSILLPYSKWQHPREVLQTACDAAWPMLERLRGH